MEKTLLQILLLLHCFFIPLKTPIVLPSLFSDNMVLQQNTDVRIWGKAETGEVDTVHVGWNKDNYQAITGQQPLPPFRTNQPKISFFNRWDTIRVLNNPHKGWYHHLFDNGVRRYAIENDSLFASFQGMDHLYLRLAWSFLEPEEGKYDWSYIDRVIKKYVPEGYGISFRITSKETGIYPKSVGQQQDNVQYATPYWVKKAGAKGVVVERGNVESWTPEWSDPVYLEKLDNFHKAFALRYDGQPWLRYVDVGSVGDWGEGHTSSSTKIPPTVEEVKSNIDVYLKNYRKTQIVVTDDLLYYGKSAEEANLLHEYAVNNGITLRDDSPMVDWYLKHNMHTWSITHPHFFDSLYLQKPIIHEMEHYSTVKKNGNWIGKNGKDTIPALHSSGADILRKTIEILHATYIGYHGYIEEWLTDNPELSKELANRCGYWYFPVSADIPSQLVKGENTISIEWLNRGVAPAYVQFGLSFRFEFETPENTFEIFLDNSGNRNWLPGINRREHYFVQIPSHVKNGDYLLKFKLVDCTNNAERDIELGLEGKSIDSEGYVELGGILIKNPGY